MKVAFLLIRANYYRLFAPIVDEALRQGWDVECWHDYSQARHGQKGYNFPALEAAPKFVGGGPRFRTYQGRRELKTLLERQAVDAVVSLTPGAFELGDDWSAAAPTWVMLQHALSNFVAYGSRGFLGSDAVALYSNYWTARALDYFRERGLLSLGDPAESEIEKRGVAVGFPEMEAAALVDADQVRRRLRIPPRRPVVLLLPYSYGFGLASFRATHAGQQLGLRREVQSLARQAWDDIRVISAIRTFCKRNGACLIVKSRLKRKPPVYTRLIGDVHLYDESVYPATILELLSIASFCIGFYSTTVHEAAYLRVPYLSLRPADGDVRGDRALQRVFLDRRQGSFDFPGVSTVMDIHEAVEELPRKSLADFALDPNARAMYIERIVGYDDGRSSERVLAELRRLKR